MLAQTFGKPAMSTALHGARTLWGRLFSMTRGKHAAGTNVSRKSLRWDWTLEANLNRKANSLALEGPSVGLYVPLLEFNHQRSSDRAFTASDLHVSPMPGRSRTRARPSWICSGSSRIASAQSTYSR